MLMMIGPRCKNLGPEVPSAIHWQIRYYDSQNTQPSDQAPQWIVGSHNSKKTEPGALQGGK